MTQRGKCHTCRRRKIKCDEVYPVCGRCRKGGRCCQYARQDKNPAAKVTDAILWQEISHGPQSDSSNSAVNNTIGARSSCLAWGGLSLKKEKPAPSGGGHFRTFHASLPVVYRSEKDNATQSKRETYGLLLHSTLDTSTPKALSSPASVLCRRWVSFMETASQGTDTPFILGDWMEFIAPRIGSSAVMDSAVKCFISSTVAYANPNDTNTNHATELNLLATYGIRKALAVKQNESLRHEILLSIILLHLAEVFLRVFTSEYLCHQKGLVNLLQEVSRRGMECTELMRRVFFHAAHWDSPSAITEGRYSMFDQRDWLTLPSLGYQSPNPAVGSVNVFQEYFARHQIILPRLARLTQQVKLSPSDDRTHNAAVELAEYLYADMFEPWFEQATERGLVNLVPTHASSSRPLIPVSYDFKSHIIHGICLEHWTVRSMTCAAILALLESPFIPEKCSFSRSQVEGEDTQRAEQIMMCVQYGLQVVPPIPVTALRHLVPLKLSWAAWRRQQLRYEAIGASLLEDGRTRRMKECCVNLAWEVGAKWGYAKLLSDLWEQNYPA